MKSSDEVRARARTAVPTDGLEQGLLVALVLLLPFEERLGALPGPGPAPAVSVAWLLFGVMLVAVAVRRRTELLRIATDRALLFGASLAVIAFVGELFHRDTDLSDPVRIGQAVVGAALIAALCRDERAMRLALGAVVAAGLVTSLIIIGFTYGEWLSTDNLSFSQITALREEVWMPGPLLLELSYAPFIAVLGAVTAFAAALGRTARRPRTILLAIAAIGFLAVALTVSRGAMGAAVVGSAAVVIARRGRRLGAVVVFVGLIAVVVAVAPNSVFGRMEIFDGGDLRTTLAELSVTEADDYLPFGVGAGRYESEWAVEHGFVRGSSQEVVGTHNSLVQVTVFWGLAATIALVGVYVGVYRNLRRAGLPEPERLALVGLAWSALALLAVSHTLYDKAFVLVFGLSVAAGHWFVQASPEEP